MVKPSPHCLWGLGEEWRKQLGDATLGSTSPRRDKVSQSSVKVVGVNLVPAYPQDLLVSWENHDGHPQELLI